MEALVNYSNLRGKSFLLTGAAGFKGRWMLKILERLNAQVIAIDIASLDEEFFEPGSNVKFEHLDIRNTEALQSLISQNNPDFIIHFAAQALVSKSYENVFETYSTNLMGTLSLLEAIHRQNATIPLVNITTDKVYQNSEWSYAYRENDKLGGKDPYSASKACVEIMSQSYSSTVMPEEHLMLNFRAGNVIGGGDWSHNRIVPDVFRSINEAQPLVVRHPQATRPWQHVLDPLLGYLDVLSNALAGGDRGFYDYNIGPGPNGERSVVDLLREIQKHIDFDYEVMESETIGFESGLLSLSTSKIKFERGWTPRFDFERSIELTAEWYMRNRGNEKGSDIIGEQVARFMD